MQNPIGASINPSLGGGIAGRGASNLEQGKTDGPRSDFARLIGASQMPAQSGIRPGAAIRPEAATGIPDRKTDGQPDEAGEEPAQIPPTDIVLTATSAAPVAETTATKHKAAVNEDANGAVAGAPDVVAGRIPGPEPGPGSDPTAPASPPIIGPGLDTNPGSPLSPVPSNERTGLPAGDQAAAAHGSTVSASIMPPDAPAEIPGGLEAAVKAPVENRGAPARPGNEAEMAKADPAGAVVNRAKTASTGSGPQAVIRAMPGATAVNAAMNANPDMTGRADTGTNARSPDLPAAPAFAGGDRPLPRQAVRGLSADRPYLPMRPGEGVGQNPGPLPPGGTPPGPAAPATLPMGEKTAAIAPPASGFPQEPSGGAAKADSGVSRPAPLGERTVGEPAGAGQVARPEHGGDMRGLSEGALTPEQPNEVNRIRSPVEAAVPAGSDPGRLARLEPAPALPSVAPPQPALARHIADQISQLARRPTNAPIELTLSPEELGRVRLVLNAEQGMLNVSVVAERAETLDLMRRHIDILAQELRGIGYRDVNFGFGPGGREQNPQGPGERQAGSSDASGNATPGPENDPGTDPAPTDRLQMKADGRVDLRL